MRTRAKHTYFGCKPQACLIFLLLMLVGCADIRFERSPYAIRGLDIIYSRQEDVTFFIWRLKKGIDPELVSFELHQDGEYKPIDLTQTLFPAEPFECDDAYVCFQYQITGRYEIDDEILPMRSIHVDEGLYAGTVPREQFANVTFSAQPVAIDNNARIDLGLRDWFEIRKIPFKRSFQWQLVFSAAPYGQGPPGECGTAQADSWRAYASPVDVDYSWVESPRCLILRPVRRDNNSRSVIVPFKPTAELYNEQQDYLPPEKRPPVVYLYLVDLLIRSSKRCEEAKTGIQSTFDRNIGLRAPNAVRLGTFTPLDTQTGQPQTGCNQAANQDYPVREMVEAIKQAAGSLEPERVRVVFVYLNNVELPPSQRVADQLFLLTAELALINNILPYTVVVGSNVVMALQEWDSTIPWRPINDPTFFGDIKNWVDANVAFRTMVHDVNTEIVIRQPVPAPRRPKHFKLCTATPNSVYGIGLTPGQTDLPIGLPYYDWPPADEPHYGIVLEEQDLVPFSQYNRQRVSVVIETCDRFCDFPFRQEGGQDYPNWLEIGACQWAQ